MNEDTSEDIWENIHSQRGWGKYPNEQLVRFIGRNFLNFQKIKEKTSNCWKSDVDRVQICGSWRRKGLILTVLTYRLLL